MVKNIGRRVTALTNVPLAASRGPFLNDIELPGTTGLAFLRSPYAHARIRSIATTAAAARPGVITVLTGADAKQELRPIPEAWNTAEIGAKGVHWYALAPDRVRYVGEAVAAVVATDRYTAFAALDDIVVDYEELPSVSDPLKALEPDSALVEPDWGDNLLITRDGIAGDADKAFADAEHTASGVVKSNRITGVPLEPRGTLASYDPYNRKLTYWDSTQNPHPLRSFLAESLNFPEGSIHVIQ